MDHLPSGNLAERKTKGGCSNLKDQAPLASWPTPNAGPQNDSDTIWQARRDECKERHGNNGFGLTLGMASQLAGPISNGSPAQTESKGQLNPAFSLWLMGYPPEWLNYAPQGTRLSRKSRQSS
jgi:hypothetical protein